MIERLSTQGLSEAPTLGFDGKGQRGQFSLPLPY